MANPMNSRCGEEGCDCGYYIEKLIELVEQSMAEYDDPGLGRSLCWYQEATKLLKKLKKEGY